jgi:hypothetical protein
MSLEEAKWHWAEGMKYAIEGIKLLFVLNGAACVSILTFIGNVRTGSGLLIWSMVSFGMGAAMTAPTMIFAYLTQLYYGNASIGEENDPGVWRGAVRCHYTAYIFMALSLLFFLAGVGLAASRLTRVLSPEVLTPHH